MKKLIVTSAIACVSLALIGGSIGCDMLQKKEEGGSEGGGDGGGADGGGGEGGGGEAAAGPDMREYFQAPDWQPGMVWEGIAVGEWYETTTNLPAANMKTSRKVSVVGKSGDKWLIEVVDSNQGFTQGYVIDKEGTVSKAYGEKDGDVKELKLMHIDRPKAVEGKEPPTETVQVKAGSYACWKNTAAGTTSWTGKDGDAKNITVKFAGAAGDYELTKLEKKDHKAGDKSYKCRVATYSNKQVMWITDKPAGPQGIMVKMTTDQMETWLSDAGTGAKPSFTWPK